MRLRLDAIDETGARLGHGIDIEIPRQDEALPSAVLLSTYLQPALQRVLYDSNWRSATSAPAAVVSIDEGGKRMADETRDARRLKLIRVPNDFDLCELMHGNVRALNLPPDAVSRRIAYDVQWDVWIAQVWSATFEPVADYEVLPLLAVEFTRVRVPRD